VSDDDAGSAPPLVSFKDLIDALPAAFAVGAAAVYGVLIVAYSEFYSELGVSDRVRLGLSSGQVLEASPASPSCCY
jgi:hypothetical protein